MTKEVREKPIMIRKAWHPIMHKLIDWLKEEQLRMSAFEESAATALSYGIKDFDRYGINSAKTFLDFANGMLTWMPRENDSGQNLNFRMAIFYFFFNEGPIQEYQTPIEPKSATKTLTWLSQWIRDYSEEIGKFLDTKESMDEKTIETFKKTPSYRVSDYIEPRGGWKSFNEFFARTPKPGARPINGLYDDSIVVHPTDSTFEGSWPIQQDSKVVLKGIQWKIDELLDNSPYREMFKGGIFMHSFLDVFDYHRQNSPVSGYVRESRLIQGQAYMKTEVEALPEKEGHKLVWRRTLEAPDDSGFQFLQMRGLIVLESPIGFVAILPVGMGHVSSVVLTAEVGRWLHKGEEISYFQYGGSDIILLFQEKAQVELLKRTKPHSHYFMGEYLGSGKVHRA